MHSLSARQGIPRRATDLPPRRIGEHYGVPISVKLVEIAEQETPEATGFDRLNAGDIDSMALSAANRRRTDVPPAVLFMGTVFSTLSFTVHNPLSFTPGCPWYYHMELLITPKTSGIATFSDITADTRVFIRTPCIGFFVGCRAFFNSVYPL